MNERIKFVIVGMAVGTCIGIAAGYGVARIAERQGTRADSRTPTDVKEAWDAYVVAQRNYMAALKANGGSRTPSVERGARGASPVARAEIREPSRIVRGVLNPQPSARNPSTRSGQWLAFDESTMDFGTV
ncbi:MAG: hypothetical protein N2689_12445, partial [Verrucomicrobiae bacterium]|nr:hypothetical protein [Verrucomicrobiae bacterium]